MKSLKREDVLAICEMINGSGNDNTLPREALRSYWILSRARSFGVPEEKDFLQSYRKIGLSLRNNGPFGGIDSSARAVLGTEDRFDTWLCLFGFDSLRLMQIVHHRDP